MLIPIQILTTIVAFSTVMLALSMIIMFSVRTVHYLGNTRARTLGEMLESLNVGFRMTLNEPAEAGDAPSAAFAIAVMTFPALHHAKTLARTAQAIKPTVPGSARSAQIKLSTSRDYIAKDDLLRAVCALSGTRYVAGQVPATPIPASWYAQPRGQMPQLPALVSYIEDYFETAEGITSDQFGASTRRLTRILASVVVVLLNFSAIDLATNLYLAKPDSDTTSQHAREALRRASDLGAIDPSAKPPQSRDALLDGSASSSLGPIVSMLDDPDYMLGWQHSWLAQAWCVAEKQCPPSAAVDVPTSRLGWVGRIFEWLLGLAASVVLLSLGAPFWADRVSQFLGWQSSVKQFKDDASP